MAVHAGFACRRSVVAVPYVLPGSVWLLLATVGRVMWTWCAGGSAGAWIVLVRGAMLRLLLLGPSWVWMSGACLGSRPACSWMEACLEDLAATYSPAS